MKEYEFNFLLGNSLAISFTAKRVSDRIRIRETVTVFLEQGSIPYYLQGIDLWGSPLTETWQVEGEKVVKERGVLLHFNNPKCTTIVGAPGGTAEEIKKAVRSHIKNRKNCLEKTLESAQYCSDIEKALFELRLEWEQGTLD